MPCAGCPRTGEARCAAVAAPGAPARLVPGVLPQRAQRLPLPWSPAWRPYSAT